MTHTDLAATAAPTALAILLDTQLARHPRALYRGVLTPRELDAPEAEMAALTRGAACHDLGWLRRVAVRGEDRFRWLSGMVTNTVNDLASGTGAWNLVLNAQGRIQGDLTVWRSEDNLYLEIAADQYERLMGHFERFIIMDDVELVPLTQDVAIGLSGPAANEVLARVGLRTLSEPMTRVRVEWNGLDLRLERDYGVWSGPGGELAHYIVWVPEALLSKLWKYLRTGGAVAVGWAAQEALRIAEGVPLYGVDIAERDLAQETSQMRALHFSKGCYLGQEIVERIRSRGNVHRHLRQLALEGPAPAAGVELLTASGAAAGTITSAAELALPGGARVFALAMLRGAAEVADEPLTYGAGAASGVARILNAAPALQ